MACMSLLLRVATSLLRSGCWAWVGAPPSVAHDVALLRGSGKVVMFPSSSLKGLITLGAIPGELLKVARVCSADELNDLEAGLLGLGPFLTESSESALETDRPLRRVCEELRCVRLGKAAICTVLPPG